MPGKGRNIKNFAYFHIERKISNLRSSTGKHESLTQDCISFLWLIQNAHNVNIFINLFIMRNLIVHKPFDYNQISQTIL